MSLTPSRVLGYARLSTLRSKLIAQVLPVAALALAAVTLIDQLGRVRGEYDLREPAEEDALVATLGLLVNNY